jgi:uncharacterized membrane protein HdeD (DUF308 family)
MEPESARALVEEPMQTRESIEALASDWMLFLARAVVALLLAVAIVATPLLDRERFAGMLGLYAVTEGVFSAIIWLRDGHLKELALEAALSIAAGLIMLMWADTAARLLVFVSLRALAVAAAQAAFARHLRTPGSPWLLGAAGTSALIAIGFLVVTAFGYDAMDLYACIAGQLAIAGTLLAIYAFKLRGSHSPRLHEAGRPHPRAQ